MEETISTRAKFITFEGIDGSGKTTQLSHLAEHLSARNIPFLKTCEPGGTQFGQEVRTLLAAKRDRKLSAFSEALLVYAARQSHVRSVIRPALDAGQWVLCDRFVDSTFAYQFFETDLDLKLFTYLNDIAVGPTMPSRTFIFDIDLNVANNRRTERQVTVGSDDAAEAHRNFARIRRGFLEAHKNDKSRCVLLDANQDESAVRNDVLKNVASDFGL